MPPTRGRAASAPKEEPGQEPVAAVDEAGDAAADAVADESAAAPDAPETPSDDSAVQTPAADGDQKPDDEGGPDSERSDLQTVERPCVECYPNGWPEGAFASGCTHGTWVRKRD